MQISESEVVELASFLSSERLDLINDLKKNYNPHQITNKSIKDSLGIISENQSDRYQQSNLFIIQKIKKFFIMNSQKI